MNIKTFKESLPYLFEANIATMVVGHHGVGKSQAVAQFASENGYEFIDLKPWTASHTKKRRPTPIEIDPFWDLFFRNIFWF